MKKVVGGTFVHQQSDRSTSADGESEKCLWCCNVSDQSDPLPGPSINWIQWGGHFSQWEEFCESCSRVPLLFDPQILILWSTNKSSGTACKVANRNDFRFKRGARKRNIRKIRLRCSVPPTPCSCAPSQSDPPPLQTCLPSVSLAPPCSQCLSTCTSSPR